MLLAFLTGLIFAAVPNYAVARETSPLVEAVRGGDIFTVRRLLANGAEVDEPVKWRKTGLYVAAALGHNAIVEVLLANGAVVDKPNDVKKTPLMVAAQKGHVGIVDTLLAHGADVNAPEGLESFSGSALGIAAFYGHIEIVEILLENGGVSRKSW